MFVPTEPQLTPPTQSQTNVPRRSAVAPVPISLERWKPENRTIPDVHLGRRRERKAERLGSPGKMALTLARPRRWRARLFVRE